MAFNRDAPTTERYETDPYEETEQYERVATEDMKRPLAAYVLMASVFFQGVSGIAGGIGLILDPSGESLGIPVDWLTGSPFRDYTIPGIVLITVLGIVPLIVFFGLLTRKTWGLVGSWFIGLALLVWIGVEILIISYQAQPPLQLIYGILGGLILIVSLLPVLRRYYGAGV